MGNLHSSKSSSKKRKLLFLIFPPPISFSLTPRGILADITVVPFLSFTGERIAGAVDTHNKVKDKKMDLLKVDSSCELDGQQGGEPLPQRERVVGVVLAVEGSV